MTKSSFFHFFPVPKFLRMPAAGLSINEDAIRFVHFEIRENVVKSLHAGEEPLPVGAVILGRIVEQDQVIQALKKLKKENNLKIVRVALPDENVYLFRTKLPDLFPNEVQSALEFKIEQNVPLSSSQVVFDYKYGMGEKKEGGREVVVGAAEENYVKILVDTLRKADLFPLSFEIESQALAEAIVPHEEQDIVLIINFDTTKTGISLIKNRVVQFSTTLPGEIDAGSQISDEKLYKRLPMVHDEIRKLLDYWREHEGVAVPENLKIYVCGMQSQHEGLRGWFTEIQQEGTLVESNPWINVPFEKGKEMPLQLKESLPYISSIGVAIEDLL